MLKAKASVSVLTTDDIDLECLNRGKIKTINSFSQDSRQIKENDCFICIKGEKVDGHSFIPQLTERTCIIGSDKDALSSLSSKDQTVFFAPDIQKAIQDLATLARDKANKPVITITGASGKTTTKDLLVHILSEKLKVLFTPANNNNLWGVPLALINIEQNTDICVLETGTNHPGEVLALTKICKPNATYTTSIGESHLEFFKDIHGVLSAETEQYQWMKDNIKDPRFVANIDDPLLRDFFASFKPTVTTSTKSKADFELSSFEPLDESNNFGFSFTFRAPDSNSYKSSLNFPGLYNLSNALGAIALAAPYIPLNEICERLPTASVTGFRSKIFRSRYGLIFNDSYNANPSSMRAAFRACLDIKNNPKSRVKSIIAVLGDMNELGESSEALHQEVARDSTEFAQILTCGRFSKDWSSGAPDKTKIFKSKNDIVDYIRSENAEDTLYLIKASHGARFDEIASSLT